MVSTPYSKTVMIAAAAAAVALGVLSVLLLSSCTSSPDYPSPPRFAGDDTVDVIHGVEVADPYRWLEDRESARTKEFIAAQREYAEQVVAKIPQIDEFKAMLTGLIDHDEFGLPLERGKRTFYSKRTAGQDRSVIIIHEDGAPAERVLVDPHELGEDARVQIVDASEDGALLLYRVRRTGMETHALHLFDVDRGEDRPDRLPAGRYYSVSITPDGKDVFYTRINEGNVGPVYRHRVGDDPAHDEMIYGDGLESGQAALAALGDRGRFLVVHVFRGSAGETDLFVLDRRSGTMRRACTGLGVHTDGVVYGGQLYLRTDWNAPTGRVMVADPTQPALESWRELIPARPESVLQSITGVGGRLIAKYLEQARSRILTFDTEGVIVGELNFDALGSVGGIRGRWNQEAAYFDFSSFHIPRSVYRYEVQHGTKSVWAKPSIPVDSSLYNAQQAWVTADDGAKIPIFVVHRKGLVLDGMNPTIVFVHGSFGAISSPRFSHSALAWLDHGGIFFVANVRGSGALGEEWHAAGQRLNKQRSIDDMIDVAEWIIDEGYASSESLGVEGHGAGGIIATAAVTQRPDLFRGLVSASPLTDMVRYEKFGMADFWQSEFGSVENAEDFAALYAYSPYHNVEDGADYPAAVFFAGGGDQAISPMHTLKLVAALQAGTRSDLPVIVRLHEGGRKSSAIALAEQVDDSAAALSLLLQVLGEERSER